MFGIAETKWFRSACESSFLSVDLDKDGKLDNKELTIAILRMYDLVNSKLPCHIKVPKHDEVAARLKKYDTNATGHLDLEEFILFCKNMFTSRRNWRENLLVRVAIVVALKVAVFPAIAIGFKRGMEEMGYQKVSKYTPVAGVSLLLETCTKQFYPM